MGGTPHIDGAALGLIWVAPFAGLLLSIAILPLAAPHFWHRHFGKVSGFWALSFLLPFAALHGVPVAAFELLHTALLEYIPFVVLLLGLFAVAGGVRVTGRMSGTPAGNTAILAIGTVIAGWAGTTGAAMLTIRPLIRATSWRRHRAHVVIFFIFLVGNIGGSLTPLGDPPLFLGFLKGVDFFWPTTHLLPSTLVCVAVLLPLFFAIDTYLARGDVAPAASGDSRVGIEGKRNILLLVAIVGVVFLSGVWKPGVGFAIFHVEVELQNLLRDVLIVALVGVSLWVTPAGAREANGFSWFPIVEVAKLFAGIFVTIIPAIAILRAGREGAMGGLVTLISGPDGRPNDAAYFWLTGLLSSFLDNAPTYLVFFNAAGGDAKQLMGPMASTLVAISAGAVFMGANTYIGNAPNFMIKAIAEEQGIKMPSFFGYMLWSGAILLPLFGVLTLIFFS